VRHYHVRRYHVRRYRPRMEGLFAGIERWTNETDPSEVFWRSISKANVSRLQPFDMSEDSVETYTDRHY
jgi:hypothetical protein